MSARINGCTYPMYISVACSSPARLVHFYSRGPARPRTKTRDAVSSRVRVLCAFCLCTSMHELVLNITATGFNATLTAIVAMPPTHTHAHRHTCKTSSRYIGIYYNVLDVACVLMLARTAFIPVHNFAVFFCPLHFMRSRASHSFIKYGIMFVCACSRRTCDWRW